MPIPFQDLCSDYELKDWQCEEIKKSAMAMCPTQKEAPKTKSGRKLSKWQICIKEKREGKPFDPDAMKRLSKLYKAGKCPTPEYLEKVRGGEQ